MLQFLNGRQKELHRDNGVDIAIRSDTFKKLGELPVSLNKRLMTLQLHLNGGQFASLIMHSFCYVVMKFKIFLYLAGMHTYENLKF